MIDFVGVAWVWSTLSELLAYLNGSKFSLGQRGLDNQDWTVHANEQAYMYMHDSVCVRERERERDRESSISPSSRAWCIIKIHLQFVISLAARLGTTLEGGVFFVAPISTVAS